MKRAILAALLAANAIFAGVAGAQTEGYVTDSRNDYVKSPFGLCWRAGYWTPALASAQCDPDLAAKPAATRS